MTKRLGRGEEIWAFVSPKLKRTVFRQRQLDWAYLYVTPTCNFRCGYCSVILPGKFQQINLGTAKESIDFMYRHGARVLALMGGEPLILGDALLEIIEYATTKRMFTYLPTNLSLLDEGYVNNLVASGVGVFDMAIDAIQKREGFDKNYEEARVPFELLIAARRKHGVHLKMNTVVTRENLPDVYTIGEIAHSRRVPIAFHLVEGVLPGGEEKIFPWLKPSFFFRKEDYPVIKKFCDWVIEKKKRGWWVTNPEWYFERIKELVRDGKHSGWKCLAGQQTLFIDHLGQVSPCFALMNQKWSEVKDNTFPLDEERMKTQLAKCNPACTSCGNSLTVYGNMEPWRFLVPYAWAIMRRRL